MKGIIMMKRQKSVLLAGLILASLGCGNIPARAGNHDSLVAGMCAAGAALLGVAGAVALADWCCSETNDQLIARVEVQCRDIYARYYDCIITYFGRLTGSHLAGLIHESVLHEFATYVWNSNSTQQDYRLAVCVAQNNLKSSVQELRKRVQKLECKSLNYQDQQRLRKMQQLLHKSNELLVQVTAFADILETHKSYFNVYDAIDVVRSKYFQEMSILESGRYSTEIEIKRSIVNRDNGQYAFRTFVINITSDINNLESKIRSLNVHYIAKKQYCQMLINQLITIKNIVVNDPRYQQELYEWEHAELQRMRLEAERERARAEQDRAWAEQRKADAMHEQNRILKEAHRIEQEKLYNQRQCNDNAVHVVVIK